MSENPFSTVRCSYYERNDWLKVDVTVLLAPWVDRVAQIYRVGKKPAKHIVTYAFAVIAVAQAQGILDTAMEIFNVPDTFQRKYGTRLGQIPFNTSILTNSEELQLPDPRQVNFMEVVDIWAMPINRNFGIGIVQCRDVVKIALSFFMADQAFPLAKTIKELSKTPSHELYTGKGKVIFRELNIRFSKPV